MKRIGICIVLLLFLTSKAYSQENIKEIIGRNVSSIEIKGVSNELELDIFRLIPIRKGDTLSISSIKRAIKLIYKVYDVDNVEVYATLQNGGVNLRFEITPSIFIRDVKIFGNDNVSSLEIIKAMDFNRMSIFSKSQETNYIERITQYLYSRGFRKAVVKSYTEKTDIPNVLTLFIIIEENERATINDVEIDVNDIKLKNVVINMLGLQKGRPLDIVEINKNREKMIKNLKRSGRIFVSVSEPIIRYNPQQNVGDIQIKVENERPVRVLVKGNKTMPLKAIKSHLLNLIDSQERIDVDIIKYELIEFYRSYGYYFVEIDVGVKRKINYDQLIIDINEKNPVIIKGFEFEGNKNFSKQVLSDVIQTYIEEVFPQESAFEQVKYQEIEYGLLISDISTPRKYQHRISIEQDKTKILTTNYLHTNSTLENFYKSKGFLGVEVSEPQTVFNKEKSQVILRYTIKEGVQTIVKKITFENNKSLSSFVLSMNTRGLKNKPLNYFELENAALGIRRMYENEGFYFVSVDYEVEFSDDKRAANIKYIIEENPKVIIKRIIPQGNYMTNDSVILSNIFLEERGLLRQSDLVSSQARLLRLSVFQDANLSILEPEYILPEKDVLVRVRENEPRYIEYSLGLSTEDGIRTTFIFNHLNLLRSALEFNSRLTLSYQVFMYIPGYYDDSVAEAYKELILTDAISRHISLGINYPKIYGIPLIASTRVDVINERVNQRAYYMDRSALSPSFEIQTLKYLSLYLQLSLDYKYLKRTPAVIPDSALSYSELQALRTPVGSNLLGSIKPTITYDKRDDKFNPHKGYYITFGTEYVQNLGSKPVSILKLNSVNTFYIPTSRKNTLAVQVSGGNIFALSEDSQTPSDMFFYLGGRSTLRGIAESALWPADIEDKSKIEGGEIKLSPGGNSYILYKVEFRFPLTRGFDGGLFVDAGNLWANFDNFSFFKLRATTGFGLRYKTPVGPIALDIGFNLMPDEVISEPIMAWHFSVGLF